MFDYETPKKEEPPDYTGLIIALILAPVFIVFAAFDKADTGLAACTVLGMTMLVVKLHYWKLRKYVWFWVTIACILAMHVPLVLIARWPYEASPRGALLLIGLVDFFIIYIILDLAERIFSKDPEDYAD